MKIALIIAIAVVLGIGIGLSVNVSAQENLIPSWIKTTAGFWVNGQIGDSEFISALQYLVKEGILVIPSEQPVQQERYSIDGSPKTPQKTTPTSVLPVSPSSTSGIKPILKTFYIEGAGNSPCVAWILFTIVDSNGNTITPNGELHLRILDFDDVEKFKEKVYLTNNSFQKYDNKVSGESTTGMKYQIDSGKVKTGICNSYDTGIGTLEMTYVDRNGSYTNTELLDHLPMNEGFFNKETGFVKRVDVDQTLNVGSFYVKVRDAGRYISVDSINIKEFKEYFRINMNTKSTIVFGTTFTLDEAYLQDAKGNIYVTDPMSQKNYVNAFLGKSVLYEGGNGYLLFEKVPSETTSLKFIMKISRIETDNKQTQFEDEIQFSIN